MLEVTSFVEISKISRNIVLFGGGIIAKKTIRKLSRNKIRCIVDNASVEHGAKVDDILITSPEKLLKDDFIIITSSSVTEISNQLISIGFQENKDFCISPILNELLAIQELENLEKTLYVTCGAAESKDDLSGGGVYKIKIYGFSVEIEKIFSGACYGIIKKNSEILFIDTNKGIFSIDSDRIEKKSDLPKGARAHGLSYNKSKDCYYIACTNLDSVIELDSKFNCKKSFNLSDKILKNKGEPCHHCNDITSTGNSVYVSMFSSTGNWKNDCFDGCITEFDINSGKRIGDVCVSLFMPHNVKIIDGDMHALDSLPGHLRFNNLSIQGTFPAFTRGLDYKDGFYYIGQSKNRNHAKVLGVSNNISIDCGIIIFNPINKISRFIQLPHTIGTVHHVLVV